MSVLIVWRKERDTDIERRLISVQGMDAFHPLLMQGQI